MTIILIQGTVTLAYLCVDYPSRKGFFQWGRYLLYEPPKKRTRKDSNLRGQRPADFKSAPLTTPALVPLRLMLRPWIEHGASRSSVLRSPNWAIEANMSLTQCGDWTHDHTIKSRALYQTELIRLVLLKRVIHNINCDLCLPQFMRKYHIGIHMLCLSQFCQQLVQWF